VRTEVLSGLLFRKGTVVKFKQHKEDFDTAGTATVGVPPHQRMAPDEFYLTGSLRLLCAKAPMSRPQPEGNREHAD
jgi:hypothetical protein